LSGAFFIGGKGLGDWSSLRNESKDPEQIPERRVRHVIVVAGPSGAGKNALIEQLMWGEPQPDVLAALHLQPREAFLIAELDHAQWMPALVDTPGRTLVLHYEMTRAGLASGEGFAPASSPWRERPASPCGWRAP